MSEGPLDFGGPHPVPQSFLAMEEALTVHLAGSLTPLVKFLVPLYSHPQRRNRGCNDCP